MVDSFQLYEFAPNDNITREQLSVILWKYAKYKGKDVSKANNLKKFGDVDKISKWALEQVKWAVEVGVITGNKNSTILTINPKGDASRAEVSSMIFKYCENVGR